MQGPCGICSAGHNTRPSTGPVDDSSRKAPEPSHVPERLNHTGNDSALRASLQAPRSGLCPASTASLPDWTGSHYHHLRLKSVGLCCGGSTLMRRSSSQASTSPSNHRVLPEGSRTKGERISCFIISAAAWPRISPRWPPHPTRRALCANPLPANSRTDGYLKPLPGLQ